MNQTYILVINCGSSSVKFSLIDPISGAIRLSGLGQCLLTAEANISVTFEHTTQVTALPAPYDHSAAIAALVTQLDQRKLSQQLSAIGHRVVHGGESYCQPTLIDEQVKDAIADLARLAPLHNNANLIGITLMPKTFPALKQVAVFDTAFHQTMPEKAFIYGIPYQLYQEHGIRRYGFHGTSHDFVSQRAAQMLNKPRQQCSFISAHLGNGCSVAAIKNGQSVDTSLGMTPLEGLVMGTRSGDLDPGIIFHLVEQLGYTLQDVNRLLNKQSGLLGISGISNDCRALEQAISGDNEQQAKQAKLALSIFSYRIAKSIASFSAALEQLDGIIFTGGIGENSALIREMVLAQLSLLNFAIDPLKNQATTQGVCDNIASSNSRACWVIPTNEEYVIARQSHQLITQQENKD